MRGLSSWHSFMNSGVLKWIRGRFNVVKKKADGVKDAQLPVGIKASNGAGQADDFALRKLQQKMDDVEEKNELLTKSALHSDILMNAMLFTNPTTDDAFKTLHDTNAWDNNTNTENYDLDDATILRTCVINLSVDYCSRVARDIPPEKLEDVTLWNMETVIYDLLGEIDPFCGKIDKCHKEDFELDECQPESCPFENPQACAYVATCLNEELKEAYKKELKEIQGDSQEAVTENKSTSGWGMA